jgi:hypothetical protein
VPLKLANTLAPDALAGELQGEVMGHGACGEVPIGSG